MKVCIIRGENLASLAGPFAIDLEGPELGGVGLFAISGPTGAGKSTLLDALCLALFGTTPRLERGSRVRIPDRDTVDDAGEAANPGLAASDPATLLRRGAAFASAECEFIGLDRRRYRAKWSIRRARDRVDGRLQAPSMQLVRVEDGAVLGGKLGETREAIVRALGLDFAQFTRAVLLAQNEFAAFLTAGEDERALLLERLTETERFAALSQRVHERERAAAQSLTALEAELGRLVPLGPDARAALDARIATSEAHLTTLAAHVDAAARAETHAAQALAIARELEAHRRAVADAEARHARSADLEAELACTLRVRTEAGPRVEASTRAEAAARAAAAALEATHAQLGARATLVAEAQRRLEASRAALDRHEAGATAFSAELDAARALDQAHARITSLRAPFETWRAAHREARRGEQGLARIRAQLVDAEREAAERDAEAKRLDDATAELTGQLAAEPAQALDDAVDQAARALRTIEAARDALAAYGAACDALRSLDDARTTRATRLASVEAERETIERTRRTLAEQRAVAERALERLRQIADRSAIQLRATLAAEEPCPVCGSTSHPFIDGPDAARHRGDALTDAVAEEKRAVDTLRAEDQRLDAARDALILERARLDAEAAADAARRDALDAQRAQAEATLDGSAPTRGWREDPQLVERVREAHAEATREVEATRLRRDVRREKERARDAALERAAQARQNARGAAEDVAALREDTKRSEATAHEAAKRAQSLLEALIRDVDDVTRGTAIALERPTPENEPGWLAASKKVEAELERDRRGRLGGRTVDAAIAARADEARALQAAQGEALSALAAAETRAAQAREAHAAAERTRTSADAEALATRDALAAWRAGATWLDERVPLSERLARDERWLDATRRAIADAERALAAARAVFTTTEARRAAHEREAPEDRVEPQDTALLDPIARADAQLRARTDRHARARAELERARASLGGDLAARTLDDDVRQRRAARESDLHDAKARASRLAELSRLVGSADGRKLRRIAQARALELVLEHANVHLAHLARRYTLRPIDGGLHLMVQDHELFGQARSVTSLSGGETFLVSLALALGLASLSAERVQIETLFIDEGFGSLDARSMQLALGALERLQAEGRQIGIISHLRELTERVGREVRVRPAGAGRSVVELDPRR